MKRQFFSFFLVAASALSAAVVTSCGDDDENGQNKYIHVDNNTRDALNQTLYADETEGKSLTFTTTGEWTSKVTPTEASSWVSISPSSGSDAKTYTVSVSLLTNSTDAERKADITISCHGEEVTIKVTHRARTQDGENPSTAGTQGLAYTLINSDTEYSVSKGTVTSGAVVIHSIHQGKPVTEIAYNAFSQTEITSVTIPASVENIGSMAFISCQNLESIIFEDGSNLENIGEGAFAISAITSITIPASVKNIRVKAFDNCSNLATVTFANGSSLETIDDSAFCNSAITSITIPASVKRIGDDAFYRCSSLATVIFASESSLETIDRNAFGDCTAIMSIIIPTSVNSIGTDAFGRWTSAQTINIPGHANEDSATAAWGYSWLYSYGDAIIVYGQ